MSFFRPKAPMPGVARRWAALAMGLLCSGVAGVVNQVVWQRSLKVVLGGSETLSSMIVVLVFLGGLGLGAALAARTASGSRNPMMLLAALELGLVITNAVVAMVLAIDISDTVYAVQRVALGAGIPLRLVYAVGAGITLLPPTVLMGATIPVASEAAQRQLGGRDAALVPVLFFVNTLGAAVGAVTASLWWLPWWGQRKALLGAIALNGLAAVVIAVVGRGAKTEPSVSVSMTRSGRPIRIEELLGAVLGFVSLGYEMLLLRALSLGHGPLPVTFALGLTAFLVCWAVGMALSRHAAGRGGLTAGLTGLAVAVMPLILSWDAARETGDYGALGPLLPAAMLYGVPVIGFGMLYGQLVSRRADDWGRDVGRYSALNTVGSCLGVLFFTLVAYEAPFAAGTSAVALVMLAVACIEWRIVALGPRERFHAGVFAVSAVASAVFALAAGLSWNPTLADDGTVTYWGRDGVVAIHLDGDVFLDGLWHTRLTDGPDGHVGRPYTWVMAAAAVLAHDNPYPKRALVIGAGVGVSGATLAGVKGLQVDGYEINETLRRVLEDRPDQTLHALTHPSLRWIWQDARTGLALDETRYDIILSAPLHLRQAGSSLLLSREYLRLVKSRMAEGGVLAVYSNEGPGAQSQLVQATLAEAFAHRTSWYDGIVTIASDSPIEVTAERIADRMMREDQLYTQMSQLDRSLSNDGGDGIFGLWDGPMSADALPQIVIVDDWPLVEHPEVADILVPRHAAR